MTNRRGVLKIDGVVRDKKAYNPPSYLRQAEPGMTGRLVDARVQIKSAGQTLG